MVQLKWSSDDVLEWIKNLGFPQYQNTFRANFIDGRKLLLVDASALVKMNIKDFNHIKEIAKEIRKLFKIELEKFDRSISLPSKHPRTLFKFYKVSSGPIYELCQQTKFFKEKKLLRSLETEIQLNHFEKLHQWLKHIPDFQNVRIGGIKRINLYFVKPNPKPDTIEEAPECSCTMPPCECRWSDKEKREPWRLSLLIKIDEGKYDSGVCDEFADPSVVNLVLMNEV